MPRILMTGASGGIGTSLRKLLPPIYPDLLLSDVKAPTDLGAHEKFKRAELSDLAQVETGADQPAEVDQQTVTLFRGRAHGKRPPAALRAAGGGGNHSFSGGFLSGGGPAQ